MSLNEHGADRYREVLTFKQPECTLVLKKGGVVWALVGPAVPAVQVRHYEGQDVKSTADFYDLAPDTWWQATRPPTNRPPATEPREQAEADVAIAGAHVGRKRRLSTYLLGPGKFQGGP